MTGRAVVDPVVLRAASLAQAVSAGRPLDALAGFFGDAARARDTHRQLVHRHGLASTQLLLLGPADAGWLRFRWRARQWARPAHAQGLHPLADPVLASVLTASVAGLAGAGWLAVESAMTLNASLFVGLLALVTGALGAWAASALSPLAPRVRRFDHLVRQQLTAGAWAVLAHQVPQGSQIGVSRSLCETSDRWCACAGDWRWL